MIFPFVYVCVCVYMYVYMCVCVCVLGVSIRREALTGMKGSLETSLLRLKPIIQTSKCCNLHYLSFLTTILELDRIEYLMVTNIFKCWKSEFENIGRKHL